MLVWLALSDDFSKIIFPRYSHDFPILVKTYPCDDDGLFYGMVDRRSLISSQDHCQRFSPSQAFDMPRGFESVQNLISDFVE